MSSEDTLEVWQPEEGEVFDDGSGDLIAWVGGGWCNVLDDYYAERITIH
jgi:hypothetical protein